MPAQDQPTVTIGKMGDYEAERVAAVINAAYAPLLGPWKTDTPQTVLSRSNVAVVLVAREANRVIGTITGRKHGDELAVERLAVDPQTQRRGVATLLFDALLTDARKAGYTSFVGYSLDSMKPAHRIYESRGARRSPERDVILPSGSSAYYYHLSIE